MYVLPFYFFSRTVDAPQISITAGRHPVVEALLASGQFVPNATELGVRELSRGLTAGRRAALLAHHGAQHGRQELLHPAGAAILSITTYTPIYAKGENLILRLP